MTTVSESVVEARVRRALRRAGEVLRKTKPGGPEAAEFGAYWTADAQTGNPERWHVHLDDLASEYGVLRPGEVIEE